jgi:hypothetical protein
MTKSETQALTVQRDQLKLEAAFLRGLAEKQEGYTFAVPDFASEGLSQEVTQLQSYVQSLRNAVSANTEAAPAATAPAQATPSAATPAPTAPAAPAPSKPGEPKARTATELALAAVKSSGDLRSRNRKMTGLAR